GLARADTDSCRLLSAGAGGIQGTADSLRGVVADSGIAEFCHRSGDRSHLPRATSLVQGIQRYGLRCAADQPVSDCRRLGFGTAGRLSGLRLRYEAQRLGKIVSACQTTLSSRFEILPSMMLSAGLVASAFLIYMACLFAIAFWGDRQTGEFNPRVRVWVYSLSLAVWCTSWTFFGAVGMAAGQIWDFLPIYIGPVILFMLGWRLYARMLAISKQENITS